MEPVARYLLRNGIGFKEFSEASKMAFVKVASKDYGIRKRQTNISRTAVLTGLTRKEVKRIRDLLADGQTIASPQPGRPAQLLDIWHHDDDFLEEDGTPSDLNFEGEFGFRSLARRAGGDVPPGALLTELKNAGAVEEVSSDVFRCTKRHFNPSGIDPYMAKRYGEVLRDLAATLLFNAASESEAERRFEYRVWNDKLQTRYVGRFQNLVREHGTSMLEFLDDWLATHQASEEEDSSAYRRCGLGLYYFEDSSQPSQD
jgi:hypothetical protein